MKRSAQQVGRAGELFVAAELNKRGALATLFLTGTPRVDVVAMDPGQLSSSVNLQVKTKSPQSWVWQTSIKKLELEREAPESDFMVLVDLGTDTEAPTYYICPLRQVASKIAAIYQTWLDSHGGKRPGGSDSTHCSIRIEDVSEWRGRWDLLGIIPA